MHASSSSAASRLRAISVGRVVAASRPQLIGATRSWLVQVGLLANCLLLPACLPRLRPLTWRAEVVCAWCLHECDSLCG